MVHDARFSLGQPAALRNCGTPSGNWGSASVRAWPDPSKTIEDRRVATRDSQRDRSRIFYFLNLHYGSMVTGISWRSPSWAEGAGLHSYRHERQIGFAFGVTFVANQRPKSKGRAAHLLPGLLVTVVQLRVAEH